MVDLWLQSFDNNRFLLKGMLLRGTWGFHHLVFSDFFVVGFAPKILCFVVAVGPTLRQWNSQIISEHFVQLNRTTKVIWQICCVVQCRKLWFPAAHRATTYSVWLFALPFFCKRESTNDSNAGFLLCSVLLNLLKSSKRKQREWHFVEGQKRFSGSERTC